MGPADTFWVYVLYSDHAQRFYVGSSEDVPKRIRQHNEGVSRWTRGRGPWTLVWSREFPNRSEARKFENLLKRQHGGEGFFKLTGLSAPNPHPDSEGS